MTNLNTAARTYALSLDAQCPPSPTESFDAGWEAAQGEIERLQGEYNAYRADGEPELRAANAEIMRLLAKLDSIRARCLNLAQWIDKGCDPKHGATEASFIALFAKEPSDEPGAHLSAGWVSLGERKPANMELELVFDQTDGEVYLARFMMYDQNRYEFILGDGTVLDLHSITHWMPLPEPPPSRTGE